MIRWLAAAFRYLLMSRAERYLGHAIDRSDFERRLRRLRIFGQRDKLKANRSKGA